MQDQEVDSFRPFIERHNPAAAPLGHGLYYPVMGGYRVSRIWPGGPHQIVSDDGRTMVDVNTGNIVPAPVRCVERIPLATYDRALARTVGMMEALPIQLAMAA